MLSENILERKHVFPYIFSTENNVANLADIKTSSGWQLSKTGFSLGLFYEVCVCVDMKCKYQEFG